MSAREEADERYEFGLDRPFAEERRAFVAGTEWQAAQYGTVGAFASERQARIDAEKGRYEALRERNKARDEAAQSAAEVERLRAWKREAMSVLSEWEETWQTAGRPGKLGHSKAEGVREHLAALAAVVDRLATVSRLWHAVKPLDEDAQGMLEDITAIVSAAPADVLAARDREVGARALEEAASDWLTAVECQVPMSRTTDQWLSARAAALREGRDA